MLDQLIIGEKASFDDFGASVATRKISAPKKKEIKETVPFSNVTYDFSAINGEVYWEERDLQYQCEIIAPTPEDLERKKTAFSSWVMNISAEKLIDPFDPDYHYIATYSDIDYADDESLEKTTATVKFKAYPYKIANIPKVYKFSIPANTETEATILNDSSHRITPTISSDTGATLQLDNISYSVPAGETTDGTFKLKAGLNTLILNAATDCLLTVRFNEEVF